MDKKRTDHHPAYPAGTLLAGRYRLIDRLGAGSQGSVYLAEDIKLEKNWAVKMVPALTGDELTALKMVSHPAFPRIVDVTETEHGMALIMDYITGETIGRFSSMHTVSIDMLYEWALEIADAFRYLHSITPAILYLDCKPSNIILGEDGHLHLVDLGSAYVTGLSGSHRISGTLPYAPPEQRRGRRVDQRSDIYALGMTLKAVAGLPEGDFTLSSYISYRFKCDKRLGALSAVVARCIFEDPADRYQSADELIYHLQHPERIGYRLPSPATLMKRCADILYKNVVTVFSVLSFNMYSGTGDPCYLLLGGVLFALLLGLCIRHKTSGPSGVWHCYKDVYLHDLTGAFILALLCALLTKDYGYAADTSETGSAYLSLVHAPEPPADDSSPVADVTIYDVEGARVLYKGQYIVSDGDSLYLYIPADSLASGRLPAYVEVR